MSQTHSVAHMDTNEVRTETPPRLGRTGPVVALAGGLVMILIAATAVILSLRMEEAQKATVVADTSFRAASEQAGVASRPVNVAAQPAEVAATEGGSAPSATSPSQVSFAVGMVVKAANTNEYGVRLRAGPGLDTLTFEIYPEGKTFTILEHSGDGGTYPVQNDGFTWWRVRAEDGLVGWLAQEFMVPVEGQ